MDVDFAFLADAANISVDSKINALGIGVDRVFSPAVPASAPSIILVAKIRSEAAEANAEHTAQIQITDEQGQLIGGSAPGLFRPQPNPEDPTEPSFGVLFLNLLGARFPSYGRYTLDFLIDGAPAKQITLWVQRAPEQGSGAPVSESGESSHEPNAGRV